MITRALHRFCTGFPFGWSHSGAAHALAIWVLCVLCLTGVNPVHALQPIVVSPDQDRIEITSLGELYEGRGDSLQIETAAGPDGAVARMSVRAVLASTNPNWIVFALSNPTDKPIERWISADRYTITGSGCRM